MESVSKQQQKPPRKYFCDFLHCGKSFTRAEHLQRHELNHRDSPNTCKRCSAHFARPDLLERHIERHSQKDKEAGGEGLGILVTRKRCWRDENGNITTKRPASSVAAIEKALEAQRQKRGYSSDESGSGSGWDNAAVPISLPHSSSSSSRTQKEDAKVHNLSGRSLYQGQPEAQLQDMPSDEFLAITAHLPQSGYPLGPTTQGVTALPVNEIRASPKADFDDIYSSGVIQNSNTPFTSLGNCNWLFEELEALGDSQDDTSIRRNQCLMVGSSQVDANKTVELAYGGNSGDLTSLGNGDEFLNFEVKPLSQQQQQYLPQNFHSLEQQLKQNSEEIHVVSEQWVFPPSDPIGARSPRF